MTICNLIARRSRPSLATVLLLLATLVALLSPGADAQPVKLSGALVSGGNVQGAVISPDGQYAVFLADKDTDGKNELYSVTLTSGLVTKISGTVVTGGNVNRFFISPNSARVVFQGDLSTAGVQELFSVPINGGTRVNLSGTVVTGGGVLDLPDNDPFAISPDSARVVFAGKMQSATAVELFSVPISGGTRTTLSGSITPGGNALDQFGLGTHFAISPDSARVVFLGDLATAGVTELFSVPITGGARTTLSGLIVPGGNVFDFLISGNGSTVVFQGDLSTDNRDELFSVPITGGTRTVLSGAVVPGGGVYRFAIAPNNATVIFGGNIQSPSTAEIFSVPIGGGTRTTISGSVVSGGAGTTGVGKFLISPDGTRVVFSGYYQSTTLAELFSVPIGGGSRATLSGSIIAGGDLIDDFEITADSTRVVFRGTLQTAGVYDVFSTPIGGGSRTLLSGTTVAGSAGTGGFLLSPDGARVVFVGDLQTVGKNALYAVPAAGGTRYRMSGNTIAGAGVTVAVAISPDNRFAIFAGDVQTAGVDELFRAPLAPLRLDFDGDDLVRADTDLLLFTRYLAGFRGTALTTGALSGSATITDPTAIANAIAATLTGPTALVLDIDSDTRKLPTTDALLLLRYQLGLRSTALVNGVLGTGATVTNPATIESRIQAVLTAIQ